MLTCNGTHESQDYFFDDVITGQDDVIMTRHPTFQISTSEKPHISRTNPPTKPVLPLNRQR